MMRWNRVMAAGILLSAAQFVVAQTTEPATAPAEATAASQAPAMDPDARAALQMLHDRRSTLKDFQAKVVYDVVHNKTDDREGKLGKVDYLTDPNAGPIFSVRFEVDTVDGHPQKKHKQALVFDGTNVTVIDYSGKTYTRRAVVGAGTKPGDATSLNGSMPLPIGIDVDEVAKNFEVTVVPPSSPDAEKITLKLVPRPEVAKRFDFKKLQLTVDRKLQLPVKVVRTERNGDITTVEFSDPEINTGKSEMVDTSLPKGPDWTLDLK